MPYDAALEQAAKEMREISPYVAAARSGVNFEGKRFRVPLFHRFFLVYYPEVRVEEENAQAPPPQWTQVLLLHYLLQAKGIPVADEWTTYRQLPGASFFESR